MKRFLMFQKHRRTASPRGCEGGWVFPLLLLLVSCDPVRGLAARCSRGEEGACEDACKRKHGESCLVLARRIEAPFDAPREGQPLRVIDDAALDRRREWLRAACDGGSSDGCRRLGETSIGQKSELARHGYDHSCERSPSAATCRQERGKEVDALERHRDGCRRGRADDCTALGDAVHRLDAPRAARIFLAEGELRGVLARVGGGEAFVRRRAAAARAVPPSSAMPPILPSPISTVPDDVQFEVTVERIEGQLAKPSADRGLQRQTSPLRGCASRLGPGAYPVSARLVVDRTGDVWTAEASGSPPELVRCVEAILGSVAMTPPVSGVADVQLALTFRRAPTTP